MDTNGNIPFQREKTFAESSLKHLLDKPLSAEFLPRKLWPLPKELSVKFGLPEDLCLMAILSFASAHLGNAFRLGERGEWAPGLGNLRFALGTDREVDLTPLFRTLGSCLHKAEKHGFSEYARNRAKPPTLEEQGTLMLKSEEILRNRKIDINLRLQDTARRTECFLGRTRPHVLLDDHIPEQWAEIAGESFSETLFATSSRGVAVRKFLDGTLNEQQRESFLRIFRAGWVEESFKTRKGRSCWSFADKLSVGAFWVLPSPLLRSALCDERMRSERLWESFLLTEVELEGGVAKIRTEDALPSLGFWRKSMIDLHSARLNSAEPLVPIHSKASEVFDRMADQLNQALPLLSPEARSHVLDWNGIAYKIAGVLHLLGYRLHEMPLDEETATNATSLVLRMGARTLHTLESAVNSQQVLDDLEAERTMARKLKTKGPVNFQTLCRSYRKQAKSLHEPVLDSLQRKKVVEIGEDRLIRLVG